jgi:hypothetical protein
VNGMNSVPIERVVDRLGLSCATEIQSRSSLLGRAPAFPLIKTLSETTIGVVPSSEEQIPQVVGKTEKTRNGMD